MSRFFLAAVTSVGAMTASSAAADPAPAANAPTVIFYQLFGVGFPIPEPAQFYVDGKKVATLVSRSCVSMRMPTGVHTVTEKYGMTLAFAGPLAHPIGVSTDWAGGQTYFYRIDSAVAWRRFSWRITTPDPAVGAHETAGIKCAEKSWADAGS